MYNVARFGWRPDLPDARDFLYTAPPIEVLPPAIDLQALCPDVYDQGTLGSCTANAICAAVQYDRKKQGLPDWTPSRLFLYYNERAMIHEESIDGGAYLRDGIKSVARQGDCPETLWPYDTSKVLIKPTGDCYSNALQYTVVEYKHIRQNEYALKACLASGFPFIFGFTVYDNFLSDEVKRTGVLPMPDLATEHVVGGHAVLAVGYNDNDQRFLVRNSWGTGWGKQGYFTMPYAYVLSRNLAADFWNITAIPQLLRP